jgi:asparagine synthase (glutamine-hydrolysing)
MCGIVGIAQESGRRRFDSDDVRKMADRIFHRGPDDDGFHDEETVVLGMRRLSIIDLEGGHQPICNEDGTIWVVNNGEIYNFQRLRTELREKGHQFTTHSDTEVLVHLYEEHGEAFLERLEGMFAVALWDSVREILIVARDRLGIKPVYYWPFAGGVAFASEIKAFLPLAGFSPAVNGASLNDYLGIGYAVAPETIFDGVSKLEPGTCLRWHEDRYSIKRYWSMPADTDHTRSYDDWVEIVRAELRRAVADHTVSDVPIGAFLSGGIDSSAVAVLMRDACESELNTYSIGYAGSSVADYYNELPFARQVADQLRSNHREIAVKPDVATLLPKLIWHLEEPISDSAITTTFLVSELSAESVKVILSGVGGDELFAGYNRYLGDHYDRQYSRIPAILRQRLLPEIARRLPSGRQNRLMDLSRYAKRFVQAGELDWRARYAFYLAIADRGAVRNLCGMANARNGLDRIAQQEQSDDELLRLLRIDWQTQLAESLLLLTDKMSMACSLECRVPFLDHRLVELAASIPHGHKLPGGRLKGLLKDSLRGVLPDAVIDRRKRGFGAPVGAWFKQELAGLRTELLGDAALERRGLLDPDAVRRICDDHDRHREDYSDLILVLMNLEIWCRLFLDGTSHEDLAGELGERSLAA